MNQIKLLYVDDEMINLQLLNINLKEKFEVYTAENGEIGLEILSKNTDIELVISDMRMPIMSGLEFIKMAKQKYPTKKYFLFSGYEITPDIQKAIDDEIIIRYFQKPYNLKQMGEEIIRE